MRIISSATFKTSTNYSLMPGLFMSKMLLKCEKSAVSYILYIVTVTYFVSYDWTIARLVKLFTAKKPNLRGSQKAYTFKNCKPTKN